MCLKRLKLKTWNTPCGVLKASTILNFLKRIWKIIKAIISRCIFVLFCFIAIWRVTEALANGTYWLLLVTLSPLAVETLHAITSRKTNQLKWITPSILFFLVSAIPCIWLLELKLLRDRLNEGSDSTAATAPVNQNIVIISATDAEWTLALEQLLIFALVLAKWISPKGGLTLDELSQLLLVNIAAGADIIELMETFGEEQVQQNSEIVYIIMGAWSWSLLQFTLVLTSSKNLPELDDDTEEIVGGSNQTNGANGTVVTEEKEKNCTTQSTTKEPSTQKTPKDSPTDTDKPITSNGISIEQTQSKQKNGVGAVHGTRKESDIIEIDEETAPMDKAKIHDKLRAEEEVEAFVQGRRCFEYFCCYNEVWGMAMSIFFQDGPFFIIRMVILFHYNVITHMNIFFTGKNIFVIILLLNRIRVIFKEDKKPWMEHMNKVKKQRRKQKDFSRKRLGLPLKSRAKAVISGNKKPLKKPRWIIWRS